MSAKFLYDEAYCLANLILIDARPSDVDCQASCDAGRGQKGICPCKPHPRSGGTSQDRQACRQEHIQAIPPRGFSVKKQPPSMFFARTQLLWFRSSRHKKTKKAPRCGSLFQCLLPRLPKGVIFLLCLFCALVSHRQTPHKFFAMYGRHEETRTPDLFRVKEAL